MTRSQYTPSQISRDKRPRHRCNRSQRTSCSRSSHSRLNHGKPKTEMWPNAGDDEVEVVAAAAAMALRRWNRQGRVARHSRRKLPRKKVRHRRPLPRMVVPPQKLHHHRPRPRRRVLLKALSCWRLGCQGRARVHGLSATTSRRSQAIFCGRFCLMIPPNNASRI